MFPNWVYSRLFFSGIVERVASSWYFPEAGPSVRLDKRVGWCGSSVWPKSEAIGPTLDNVSGECAELERAVELVNNLEGTGPPKS